ncbi:c4-dicarboxylate transporter [Apiospora phragmitis]|uniref:C4-dicarboxylate transporter n=1 Tax=Apiospora phragmitis TaxID=2905665 RepID=A0ABR1WTU6_9PEZI
MPRPLNLEIEATANGYITPREGHHMSGDCPLESSRLHERRVLNSNHQAAPSPASLAKMLSNAQKQGHSTKVGLRDRICCHQWNWFTMTMATGGVSNVLHTLPYDAKWLYYIGLVFMIINICFFVANCALAIMRFSFSPGAFIHSFTDQMECLFIPAVVAYNLRAGIILINVCEYGIPNAGPWLQRAVEVLFWVYITVSVTASCGMYLILWSTQIFPIHTMTPVWVFPAYPLLLAAPFATNLITGVTQQNSAIVIHRMAISLCALTVQGTGFLISFMVCAAFLYRLMTQKLPQDMQRPGVFISIGPAGFTCAGVVVLGSQVDMILPDDMDGRIYAIWSLRFISIVMGLWLWGLSKWFFVVSVGSLHKYLRKEHTMPFQMTWWSFVFPNTALVTATSALAKAFNNTGLKIYSCVMAAILIFVWCLVLIRMIKALWRHEVLWPKEVDSD